MLLQEREASHRERVLRLGMGCPLPRNRVAALRDEALDQKAQGSGGSEAEEIG